MPATSRPPPPAAARDWPDRACRLTVRQRRPNNWRPSGRQRLRPAECDQVAAAFARDERDKRVAAADPCLELHVSESGRAVARKELACPGLLLVLRLIGEQRQR